MRPLLRIALSFIVLLFGMATYCLASPKGEFPIIFNLSQVEDGRPYRLPLSYEIFKRVQRSYEDEMAVFDVSGNVTPFVITTARQSEGKTLSANVEAKVFPLPDTENEDRIDLIFDSVRSQDKVALRQSRDLKPKRYLLDLGEPDVSLLGESGATATILSLDLGGKADVMASARIETSHNLRDWKSVSEREPLVRLNRGLNAIESKKITLQGAPRRFMLLTLENAGDMTIKAADVEYLAHTLNVAPLDGSAAVFTGTGKSPGMLLYESDGLFPIEQVLVKLTTPGAYAASLYSRSSPQAEWRRLSRITVSYMKTEGGELRNVPLDITPPLQQRYWCVSFDVKPAGEAPKLLFSWTKREIVFLAQGGAPYSLGVGGPMRPGGYQSPQLISAALRNFPEKEITQALVGEAVSNDIALSGGDGEEHLVDWDRYLMWGVLVSGAVFLSWMAIRLLGKA